MMKVSVTSNAERVSLNIRNRFKELPAIALAVAIEERKIALAEAIRLSSFTDHSLLDLRRNKHPYAKLHGPGTGAHMGHPEYLHTHSSGGLVSQWSSYLSKSLTGASVGIYNRARYARYMTAEGTIHMIGRPIMEAVAKKIGEVHHETYMAVAHRILNR